MLGWKEYELEVMRDTNDNVVIICSIENFDPMGVHTGDSITVAPAMTLTDKEYQRMRDAAIAVIREIGVETGGSNIQFAVDPETGAHDRHRDEPARVAQLGAGVEGDRLPDREDRRQARGRLHARRAPQRHHARDAGVVRADDRLRGRQVAALRVREVPGRRRDARPADEVGRRGDGDRPHVQGERSARRSARSRPAAAGFDLRLAAAARRAAARSIARRRPRSAVAARRGVARSGMSEARRSQLTQIDPWFLAPPARDGRRGRGAAHRRRGARAAVLDDAAALRAAQAASACPTAAS